MHSRTSEQIGNGDGTIKGRPEAGERIGSCCRCAVVTGASGFFGANLCRKLLASGVPLVRALDIKRDDHIGVFEAGEKASKLTFIQCDITCAEQVCKALEGADVVFHTAALINLSSTCYLFPKVQAQMHAVNIGGTKTLLECAAHAGVRAFVYTSSGTVIGSQVGDTWQAKEEEIQSFTQHSYVDSYSAQKYTAEQMVTAFDGTCHVRTVCLRPPGIWGPSCHAGPMLMALEGGLMLGGVFLKTRIKTDWCHVQNLVNAHVLAAERVLEQNGRSKVAGSVYNITDGVETNTLDFFGDLAVSMGQLRCQVFMIPSWFWCIFATFGEPICYHLSKFLGLERPLMPLVTMSMGLKGKYHFTLNIGKAREELDYVPLDVQVLKDETAAYLKQNWAPRHLVHHVPLFFWVAAIVFMALVTFLTFADPTFWGQGPWRLTKKHIFDHIPGLGLLSLARYQDFILWHCVYMPMLSVHLMFAVLACYLAKQAGSNLWGLWGVRTLLLGFFQLRYLLQSWAHMVLVVSMTVVVVGNCITRALYPDIYLV